MISQYWKSSSEGQFEYRLEEDGSVMAFMDLLLTETGKVVIKHTEVDPSLGGQGIGKSLLEAVAEFCRSNEYRILAVCPFAKNLMYRYPDQYKDLI